MKTRIFSLSVIVVLTTFVLTSAPMPLQSVGQLLPGASDLAWVTHAAGDYVNGQVVAQIKSGGNGRSRSLANHHNLTVLEDLEDDTYLFGIPDSRTVLQVVNELSADNNVVWAQPNYWLKAPEVSQRSHAFVHQRSHAFVHGQSPAEYFAQYAVQLIRAAQAQAITNGSGVTVAVIDTGVDTSHPVFSKVGPGYDFVDDDPDPSEEGFGDAYGHGTFVAGLVVLVAPGATIMPVRAFDATGVGTSSQVAKAIRWAVRQGADVINMSFGYYQKGGPIQGAVSFAAACGAVLIAAAGNDNISNPMECPACDNRIVMAVAATDQNDVKADFSNYGSYIDVCAPGVSLYSAYPDGQWAWWDGTSFSTPLVSGEAALVLSAGGGNADRIIENTAVPVSGSGLGSGRIDCLAAVSQ